MKTLVLSILLLPALQTAHAQTKNFIDQPYIEVNGNVDTLVTPNEIFIKITIAEKDTRDKISVEEAETKMIAALKSLNLDTEKSLSVNDMSSNFRYYLLKSKDVLKSKQYTLKVTDAAMVSKVFSQLEELGIANTSIDRVGYTDMERVKNLMRAKAIENARTRALALTRPLNQTVGAAINITDNENYNVSSALEGRVAGLVIRGYASQPAPDIEFEKIKLAVNINVKFVLR